MEPSSIVVTRGPGWWTWRTRDASTTAVAPKRSSYGVRRQQQGGVLPRAQQGWGGRLEEQWTRLRLFRCLHRGCTKHPSYGVNGLATWSSRFDSQRTRNALSKTLICLACETPTRNVGWVWCAINSRVVAPRFLGSRWHVCMHSGSGLCLRCLFPTPLARSPCVCRAPCRTHAVKLPRSGQPGRCILA